MRIFSNGKALDVKQLEDSNANLVSAIAELVSVNASLINVNTRALDNTDIAQIPLPYDLVHVYSTNTYELIDTNTYVSVYQASGGIAGTNWGAGLDFYPMYSMFGVFTLVDETCFSTITDDGFHVIIYERLNGTTVTMFRKTYNSLSLGQFHRSGAIQLFWTEKIFGNKINATNKLEVEFRNYGGCSIRISGYTSVVSGIAIPPP